MKQNISLSLAETLSSEWDGRFIRGMSKAVNGGVYTIQDHETATYLRNPSLWCADVVNELTSISPWNSEHKNRVGGTLITKRHIITSAHAALSISSVPLVVRFVDADSNVHTRTIIGSKTSANWSGRGSNRSDFRVYTLDSDLPASIKPCKIMPSNWENYLPDLDGTRPPQLVLDQEEKALVADLKKVDSELSYGAYPIDADRLIFSETAIGGDSGNPAFFIVDPAPNDPSVSSELVLNYVLTFGGSGTGTSLASSISLLNSAIAGSDANASARSGISTINTGYTVTEADFSYYTDYSSFPKEEIVLKPVGVGTTTPEPVGVGTTTPEPVGVGTTTPEPVGFEILDFGEEEIYIDKEVEPTPEQLNMGLEKKEIYLLAAGAVILLFILKWTGFFSSMSKYLDNGL